MNVVSSSDDRGVCAAVASDANGGASDIDGSDIYVTLLYGN